MVAQKNKIISVPVEISKFVYENKLIKPFAILLYLKLFTDGTVPENHEVFTRLRKDLKMTDPKDRTYRKHFKKLLDLGWVRQDPKTGTFWILSFYEIKLSRGFKTPLGTRLVLNDILQLQVYLASVIISTQIRALKYYRRNVKGRSKMAVGNRHAAYQSKTSLHSSEQLYFGLCNDIIAQLLGCKYTRASQLKNAAAKAGYIIVNHRYKDIAILKKTDYLWRPILEEMDSRRADRMRFWRPFKIKGGKIKVVEQLYDEIIPKLRFVRAGNFAAYKLSLRAVKLGLPSQIQPKVA